MVVKVERAKRTISDLTTITFYWYYLTGIIRTYIIIKGILNENQLTIVKEYDYIKPFIQKIHSIIDNCYRDFHINYFHTFKNRFLYKNNFTNIKKNEILHLPISDEGLVLYEINKKLKLDRQRGFIFDQINKLTIKIYSNLQSINLCYHSKQRIPMCHSRFFRRILQNN